MNKLSILFISFCLIIGCLACSSKKKMKAQTLDDKCYVQYDPGPCRMAINRYYYDQEEKKCKEFIYGGCKGQVPFKSLAECQKACGCVPDDAPKDKG